MTIEQYFCNVNDLVSDQSKPGGDETRLLRAIKLASDYLAKRIGWFIPVTQTRNLEGKGLPLLLVPPLIAITSISNDGTTLSAADYILRPELRFWANGPYTEIHVDPDATNLSYWCEELASVIIAGRWGMYEETEDTTTTVQDNPQTNSQTTLVVANAAKVSLGDLLKVESEQQLVTGRGALSSATTLAAACAITDDSLTLTNGALVNVGEILRIDVEQMYVRDINSNTAYITRGYNGTTRAAHSNGATVQVYRTFNIKRGVNGTTAAQHAQTTAISRYKTPEDINTLTREIAILGLNKANSAYQGRTGNEQLGVVFYNDIFPRFDLSAIEDEYNIPRAG